MKTLSLSALIPASPEVVWTAITSDTFYRVWANVFSEGSFFVGTWEANTPMQFLGPNENGVLGGLTSMVIKNIPYKELWLEHRGFVMDGKEDYTSEEVKKWAPSFERYFLEAEGQQTRFRLEMQMDEDWYDMMEESWKNAFIKLSELCANILHVSTVINTPQEEVWNKFTEPTHIVHWNFADDSWHCPKASNDVQVGGKLVATMAAKDGSMAFDFTGTYTAVIPHRSLEYTIAPMDEYNIESIRRVVVKFTPTEEGTRVDEFFEAESLHSHDLQKAGWTAILQNFKAYVEGSK